eukprot:scaffold70775_cov63-Phaeocystis_antarctica.AAC.2
MVSHTARVVCYAILSPLDKNLISPPVHCYHPSSCTKLQAAGFEEHMATMEAILDNTPEGYSGYGKPFWARTVDVL